MRQEYEEGDVQEILKRAMHLDAGTQARKDILRASAAELGISDEALAQAELQWLQEKGQRDELQVFMVQRKRAFWEHLTSYVIVNAFLVCINFFTDSNSFWALYPILGWGIGIAFHAIATFKTDSE